MKKELGRLPKGRGQLALGEEAGVALRKPRVHDGCTGHVCTATKIVQPRFLLNQTWPSSSPAAVTFLNIEATQKHTVTAVCIK